MHLISSADETVYLILGLNSGLLAYKANTLSTKLHTSGDDKCVFFSVRMWLFLSPDEPCHEKTCLHGFRPGPTQTGLYGHRKWLEAYNFEFRKKKDCTIYIAKTKVLISCRITEQLICAFVFSYAKSRFSHDTFRWPEVSQNIRGKCKIQLYKAVCRSVNVLFLK